MCAATLTVTLTLAALTLAEPPAAAPAAAPPGDPAAQVEELVNAQGRLIDEVQAMRRRIEALARMLRQQDHQPLAIDDLGSILARLDSDDFAERQAATVSLRRALIDRMWLLIENPDLTEEARHRMRSILVEASAMIRLTNVAVDLEPADRDALWNLLDAHPKWLLDALGDDPEKISDALRQPPPGHELGAEVVQAALVRDGLRPFPQLVALESIDEVSGPLLRDALLSLLESSEEPSIKNQYLVTANRDEMAAMGVRILARSPYPAMAGHLLAALRGGGQFRPRLDSAIVDALVGLKVKAAAPELVRIATEKRSGQSGGHNYGGVMVRPGDCELAGAALLMELNLDELKFESKRGWREGDPNMYGFSEPKPEENPDRVAAFEAVGAAVQRGAEPGPVPGYEDGLRRFGREP
jgi:hypothetical protein